MDEQTRLHERIWELSETATRSCAAFEPPPDPPDEGRAMGYLREGVGPAVALFLEGRTGGRTVYFPPDEYRALESAMNAYLDLYCACYGVDIAGECQLRAAAELLVDTHNIRDVAQILTGVPER